MPRIYTKTGDDGTTGMLYGGRVAKNDPRVEAYGASDEAVAALEGLIDSYIERTTMPREFVIPGETRASAAIDLARAIVRRCERAVAGLTRENVLPDGEVLRYLNRLADLLFVLARFEESG